MTTSSWDEMKRVREEEYFHKQEQEQLQKLKEQGEKKPNLQDKGLESIAAFSKGKSPLTGASFYKASVSGSTILDCPEEETLLLSYKTILKIIDAAEAQDKNTIHAWQHFLTGQNS